MLLGNWIAQLLFTDTDLDSETFTFWHACSSWLHSFTCTKTCSYADQLCVHTATSWLLLSLNKKRLWFWLLLSSHLFQPYRYSECERMSDEWVMALALLFMKYIFLIKNTYNASIYSILITSTLDNPKSFTVLFYQLCEDLFTVTAASFGMLCKHTCVALSVWLPLFLFQYDLK